MSGCRKILTPEEIAAEELEMAENSKEAIAMLIDAELANHKLSYGYG